MADSYIDQYETIAYGRFASAQILLLIVGLDAALDSAMNVAASRVKTATDTMETLLQKAGAFDVVTYKPTKGAPDIVAEGRDVLRRLVKYAESRPDGAAIAEKLLHGENVGTVLRRRPTKLLAALTHSLTSITEQSAKLPEHAAWTTEVTAARDALDTLDKSVRVKRVERRGMTPEIAAARTEWLKQYGAAKLLVEGVLKGVDRVALLSEVFDDLAEVHRVAGVTDDPAASDAPPDAGTSSPA